VASRYLGSHFQGTASPGRQYSLLGDAELDEGAVWEAVVDPGVAELGEVVWVVDVNRQSLDRVVPLIATDRLRGMFTAAGWQVITLKYGRLLEDLFTRPGGDALRHRIDAMPNPEYQRLLRCDPAELRRRLPAGDEQRDQALAGLIAGLDDPTLTAAIRNLGGHDLSSLNEAFAAIDDDRPTLILAYTIKGYGLPIEGHPQNHSALLTAGQIRELAAHLGTDADQPWHRFPQDSAAGRLCAETTDRLKRPSIQQQAPPDVPEDLGHTPTAVATTQAALGRALLDLTREAPEAAGRVVTVSPDVSSSTNLGGWVNKVGVWSASERTDWFADDAETILHWREKPTGQHIELGIAETNLVGLIGELGATWSRWGQPLLPIGVLYDPFVERALEPWSFGIYAGGQSILVGTPSGVSLAPEGGAHQSITTPSIGIEQPGCVTYEPAFALDTEWCLLASLARLRARYDVVICEGAGSPAEINLRDTDVANMSLARAARLPVVVVGDIDRGGVFAAMFGTLALLSPEDQALIAGFVINKFRGAPELLDSGLTMLRELTGRPVYGVLPWRNGLELDAEDSLALNRQTQSWQTPGGQNLSGGTHHAPFGKNDLLRVAVVKLPRISNFTDADALAAEPGVLVRFADHPAELADADLVVLPGSRATVADLAWLRERGLAGAITDRARAGRPVLGICGGYQMLAEVIDEVESALADSSEREMSTTAIGEMLMTRLKVLDKIAYVRFASVYRDFQDVEAFLTELKDLLQRRG